LTTTGFVVTVEPGLYFVKGLLFPTELTTAHAFVNMDLVQEYLSLGGVRIEDCVVVTKEGHSNLTTVPKEIEDIERIMA
jgi:Xaa-Pro dipeptidase